MILLADVKDWLKTVFEADHYYTGKLDNKKDRWGAALPLAPL